MTLLYFMGALSVAYLLVTLVFSYVVHRYPRHPVHDPPDWGTVSDLTIPAADGGFLELWRVAPEGPSRGIVVLAHGWSRNRDRMTERARFFGQLGFTTLLHSARDHGGSSPKKLVNAPVFAQDISTVLDWVGEPVILYGHSMGAVGAALAAARDPQRVQLLFLEGCYAHTRVALHSLYRWFNPFFGNVIAPMMLVWMNRIYGVRLADTSPARMASRLRMPVMVIHGDQDRRFPLAMAQELRRAFSHPEVAMYVGKGAGHSDTSQTPGYAPAVEAFLNRYLPPVTAGQAASPPVAAAGP
ncbi:MAG: alpha/beta fold hydrolase [Desulfobacterales bacterium]|jgi:pimeloyl-ACP methyl ester carboxylesterase